MAGWLTGLGHADVRGLGGATARLEGLRKGLEKHGTRPVRRALRIAVRLTYTHMCNNDFFTPDKQLFATSPIGAAAYLFDGVAAIALAADAALNASKEQDAPILGPMLLEELLRVSFDGASGHVALNAQGDRDRATIQFALGNLALEGTDFTYYYNFSSTGVLGGMVGIAGAPAVQWIGGGKGLDKQPPDAYTSKLLAQAEKREAAARWVVVGGVVGLLMAIVATLGVTIWWVRVRRVAKLYQVSPWQLIRDSAAAETRAVHFVFVKVHRWWLKLSSAGAIRQRVAVDDDDARGVRGNALLVAAGWRAGLHVQMSMHGRRDQLKGQATGKARVQATTTGEVNATEVPVEVMVEVQAYANQSGKVWDRGAGGARGGSGGDSSRGSGGSDSNSGMGSRLSNEGRLFSSAVRGGMAGPVTRRLMTACNTDWRVQPNAIDVCKAPTATQTSSTTCHIFASSSRSTQRLKSCWTPRRAAARATAAVVATARVFPGLRLTVDGWLRFQSVEQLEHDVVEQLKLFRAAANRRHKASNPATRLLSRVSSRRFRAEAKSDAVNGALGSVVVTVGGGDSLTFVELSSCYSARPTARSTLWHWCRRKLTPMRR
eukprot:scaffold30998_cov66-Phaeocystis_antarctica.AAC.1